MVVETSAGSAVRANTEAQVQCHCSVDVGLVSRVLSGQASYAPIAIPITLLDNVALRKLC